MGAGSSREDDHRHAQRMMDLENEKFRHEQRTKVREIEVDEKKCELAAKQAIAIEEQKTTRHASDNYRKAQQINSITTAGAAVIVTGVEKTGNFLTEKLKTTGHLAVEKCRQSNENYRKELETDAQIKVQEMKTGGEITLQEKKNEGMVALERINLEKLDKECNFKVKANELTIDANKEHLKLLLRSNKENQKDFFEHQRFFAEKGLPIPMQMPTCPVPLPAGMQMPMQGTMYMPNTMAMASAPSYQQGSQQQQQMYTTNSYNGGQAFSNQMQGQQPAGFVVQRSSAVSSAGTNSAMSPWNPPATQYYEVPSRSYLNNDVQKCSAMEPNPQ